MNALLILNQIHKIKYRGEQTSGFARNDADFARDAADVMVAADADQYEDLVRALSAHCATYATDTGDNAYAEAAKHLLAAAEALNGRLGN